MHLTKRFVFLAAFAFEIFRRLKRIVYLFSDELIILLENGRRIRF